MCRHFVNVLFAILSHLIFAITFKLRGRLEPSTGQVFHSALYTVQWNRRLWASLSQFQFLIIWQTCSWIQNDGFQIFFLSEVFTTINVFEETAPRRLPGNSPTTAESDLLLHGCLRLTAMNGSIQGAVWLPTFFFPRLLPSSILRLLNKEKKKEFSYKEKGRREFL